MTPEISRDVRPPVQMRGGSMAFSRVSTGDSDIPSSCEMKDEPAFKTLHGNPAFFQVIATRGPFHLRPKTEGPSHLPVAEGKLFLRCLWKGILRLQFKTGIQLSSQDDIGCTDLYLSCCTEIDDVRPTVQMRRRPRALSRDSTGDSDIPSSCDMKD